MKKVSERGNQTLIGCSSDNRTDIGRRLPMKMRVNLSIGREGGVYLYSINTPYRRMIDGD